MCAYLLKPGEIKGDTDSHASRSGLYGRVLDAYDRSLLW